MAEQAIPNPPGSLREPSAARQPPSASAIRDQIPALGYREYWYPALPDRKVGSRPVGLRLLGEDLVFFRGASGQVAALANACPHRGGSLMHGKCHYRGTVACPYHGWVFDEHGDCLAVLSEGPASPIPALARARRYPTRTLRGLVFVWMGEGRPAAIEEDVPPEFFEPAERTLVFTVTGIGVWPVNWRVALENSLDSHVMYVHRNSVLHLTERILQVGPTGFRPRIINDKACAGYLTEPPAVGRQYYPRLKGWWPKTEFRRAWTWMFRQRRTWADFPPFNGNDEWDMDTVVDGRRMRPGGHHLPTMFRVPYGPYMYTRCCVPIDENSTRVFYYHAVRPRGFLRRLGYRIYFHLLYDWLRHYNFSTQDYAVMAQQRYDLPETLSSTDAQVVAWRRLLLKARRSPDGRRGADVHDIDRRSTGT